MVVILEWFAIAMLLLGAVSGCKSTTQPRSNRPTVDSTQTDSEDVNSERVSSESRPTDEGEGVPGFTLDSQRVRIQQNSNQLEIKFLVGAVRCPSSCGATAPITAAALSDRQGPPLWQQSFAIPTTEPSVQRVGNSTRSQQWVRVTAGDQITTESSVVFAPAQVYPTEADRPYGFWRTACAETPGVTLAGVAPIYRQRTILFTKGHTFEDKVLLHSDAQCSRRLLTMGWAGLYQFGFQQADGAVELDLTRQRSWLAPATQAVATDMSVQRACGADDWDLSSRELDSPCAFLIPMSPFAQPVGSSYGYGLVRKAAGGLEVTRAGGMFSGQSERTRHQDWELEPLLSASP